MLPALTQPFVYAATCARKCGRMNNKRKVALLSALCIVAVGQGGYLAYDSFETKRAAEAAAAAARATEQRLKQQAQAEREVQAQILRSPINPGPSPWLPQGLAPPSAPRPQNTLPA